MDAGRSAEPGRADEAAQTRRVDRDTENGTQFHTP